MPCTLRAWSQVPQAEPGGLSSDPAECGVLVGSDGNGGGDSRGRGNSASPKNVIKADAERSGGVVGPLVAAARRRRGELGGERGQGCPGPGSPHPPVSVQRAKALKSHF